MIRKDLRLSQVTKQDREKEISYDINHILYLKIKKNKSSNKMNLFTEQGRDSQI